MAVEWFSQAQLTAISAQHLRALFLGYRTSEATGQKRPDPLTHSWVGNKRNTRQKVPPAGNRQLNPYSAWHVKAMRVCHVGREEYLGGTGREMPKDLPVGAGDGPRYFIASGVSIL